MKKQTEKPECPKSPTGKHQWEETKEDLTRWPKGDWGCIPGWYCVHCGERRKEEKT